MKNNTTDLKSFNYLESGKVTFSMLETIKTVKKLDKGLYSLYKIDSYNNPEIVIHKEIPSEIHSLIKYNFISKIEEIYNKFFNLDIKENIKKLNHKHKLGVILHGKQGTAKTSILKHYYIRAIEEHDALVFYFKDKFAFSDLWDFISKIRKIQDNPIVIFFDEFDEFFYDTNYEDLLKMIMDGHLSIDNCIFLAATNYIHKIPETILDRPSRIKYSFELGGLEDKNLILEILKNNLYKIEEEVDLDELEALAKESIGKTVDEIKEIILDRIMDIDGRVKNNVKKIGFNR